jgi:curved DNA-binding protein
MRAPDLEGEITIDLLQALRGSEMQLNVQGSVITVRIPPGARDGSRLRVRGRGAAMAGAETGDLVVIVHVRPHPLFWIEGDDLHVRLPVTVGEAWKGARVRVPTAEGDVFVRVPPHTDSGARLRLRGKGLPGTSSHPAGDLMVHVEVVLPPSSADIDQAIEALEKAYPTDPRADLHL